MHPNDSRRFPTATVKSPVLRKLLWRAIRVRLWLLPGTLFAAPATHVIPLSLLEDQVWVSPSLEVLKAPEANLPFEEILKPELARRFRPLRAPYANFGYTNSTYWARFSVENQDDHSARWTLSLAHLEFVRAYVQREGRPPESSVTGKRIPYDSRPLRNWLIGFPLELAAHEQVTVYLEIRSEDTLFLQPLLSSPDGATRRFGNRNLSFGLLLGLFVAVIVYNLAVWFAIRDKAYLWYVLFELCAASLLATATGLFDVSVWPKSGEWSAHAVAFFGTLVLIPAYSFAWHLLDFSRFPYVFRAVAKVMQTLAVFQLLAILFAWKRWYYPTSAFQMLACGVFLATVGLFAWARGAPNARYYVLAWTSVAASIAYQAFAGFGFAPLNLQTAQKVSVLATGAEAIFLSLALSRRLGQMRRAEKEAREALLSHKEEQARQLESLVEQRTHLLERAQLQLIKQARVASIGRVFAGMTHEIANPLNFTLGGTEAAGNRLRLVKEELGERLDPRVRQRLEEAQDAFGMVRSGAERIKRIVESIRGHLSDRPSRLDPVDVREVLDEALTLVQDRISSQGVTIERNFQEVPAVEAVRGQLEQVFLNLLTNACLAMPQGGTLLLHIRAEGPWVVASVTDTGPGVPDRNRDLIFEPFFTTRDPAEGTGLGLSLSLEIVKRFGGELSLAESTPGATFVVLLRPSHARPESAAG